MFLAKHLGEQLLFLEWLVNVCLLGGLVLLVKRRGGASLLFEFLLELFLRTGLTAQLELTHLHIAVASRCRGGRLELGAFGRWIAVRL